MRRITVLGWLLVAGPAALEGLWAQNMPSWRFWDVTDGLKESYTQAISVDPSGRVWVKHGDVDTIGVFDGYHLSTAPSPRSGARVYGTRNGQAWAEHSLGLEQYKDGQWIVHPIKEVQEARRRGGGSVGFLPVDGDRVLLLLPDRILEYEPAPRVTRVLKGAAETRLERFIRIAAARDGGAWITGRMGVGKLGRAAAGGGHRRWREAVISIPG